MDSVTVVIYTTGGVLEFDVRVTVPNFADTLADAIDDGSVVLDMVDGNKLIINPINAVVVGVREVLPPNS